jgi:hypothetical protein
VPLKWASAEVKQAVGGAELAMCPMALRLEPTTAQPMAELDAGSGSPVILRNQFGQGEAILIGTSEAALQENPAFWDGLRTAALGHPTLACSQIDRYRIILTEVDGKHVLHVIDQTTTGPGYRPAEVKISLNAQRLGNPRNCSLCEGGPAAHGARPVDIKREDGRISLVLRPDPVASVVLQ